MARSEEAGASQKPVVIKKYANRRLYNTATSSYVTLDHLCHMVKDDVDFVVYDAKSGEDITRSVLTQIIVEEESKGTHLLPITFLRQLISFYGHSMQGFVPNYLEQMMAAFAANQDRLRQQMQETMSGMFPFGTGLEEMSRQNAALMESAMKMFTPFGAPQEPGRSQTGTGETGVQEGATATGAGDPAAPGQDEATALATLQQQVRHLQDRIDALSKPESPSAPDVSRQTSAPAQTPTTDTESKGAKTGSGYSGSR